jgi:mono/diheme cytochrome c family protein
MDFLTDFSSTWSNPQMRHAVLVHMPIALSMLAAPVALLAALAGGRFATLRWITVGLLLLLAGSGFLAKQSGELAEETVEGALSEEGEHVLEEHEELAEWVWIFGLATAFVAGLGFFARAPRRRNPAPPARAANAGADARNESMAGRDARNESAAAGQPVAPAKGSRPTPRLQVGSAWAAALLALFTAGWVANTAHHGGKLVYEFGVITGSRVPAPASAPASEDAADPRVAHFRERVYPVLTEICAECHNPDGMRKAGRFDVATMATILKGGRSGAVLVPGKPEESRLYEAVTWENEDLQMPPPEKLSDEAIEAIRAWIAGGAVWAPPE